MSALLASIDEIAFYYSVCLYVLSFYDPRRRFLSTQKPSRDRIALSSVLKGQATWLEAQPMMLSLRSATHQHTGLHTRTPLLGSWLADVTARPRNSLTAQTGTGSNSTLRPLPELVHEPPSFLRWTRDRPTRRSAGLRFRPTAYFRTRTYVLTP